MRTVSSITRAAFVSAAAAILFQASGMDAHAAFGPVNYGTFTGNSVSYEDVTESSGTENGPLFGAPTVSGDTLDFNPHAFSAFSSGGGAPDITSGQLNLSIRSLGGTFIDALVFSEAGDFTIAGLGTADTFASVSATFFLDIVEVDGVGIDPISLTYQMTFTPETSGKFTLPDYGTGSSIIWSGEATIDIGAALVSASQPFDLGATRVNVALNNNMVAASESGSTSFIAKKDFKGLAITVIPEPSTVGLALVGGLLMGVLVIRRRRDAIARA